MAQSSWPLLRIALSDRTERVALGWRSIHVSVVLALAYSSVVLCSMGWWYWLPIRWKRPAVHRAASVWLVRLAF